MRDKIERFANGDFEYETPLLILSEKEVAITVEEGKTFDGSFMVSNNTSSCMKGVLYSSNSLLTLDKTSFCSNEHTVQYKFDATYEKAGEVIEGNISIISEFGEKVLPFTVTITMSYVETSIGKIGDLFQLTNLAKQNWSEAKKVFQSEDFERIFLKNDKKYIIIYQGLIKSTSTSQALEEFLVAINKKSKLKLAIDRTAIEYQSIDEGFMDKLILSKNHWGYAQIKVNTDADFIQLDQKYLWADSFIGSTHQISYVIDTKGLRAGKNYGNIYIQSVHQKITVQITCHYQTENQHKDQMERSKRQLYHLLTSQYIHFRLNKINISQYISKTKSIIEELALLEDQEAISLLKTYIAVITSDADSAQLLLEEITDEEELRRKSPLLYCAYHYLLALFRKDDSTVQQSCEKLHHYYNKISRDWRIQWFILYTDKRYENDLVLKLNGIKEQFKFGCRSPILYYEAVNIYNEEPVLLKELSEFEIQTMNFGIRNAYLGKETVLQYIYLAGKMKKFHPLIYKGLTVLYEKYKSSDILSAICSMLIKGIKKSNRYFPWYQLGVEDQLRVTELYEYYMYSISEDYTGLLAQPILLYFIYNSNLNDSKRAFLYANIVQNKEKIESIYRSYYKRLEVFAKKQLEAHNINKNLAIIYEDIFGKKIIEPELLPHLHEILYEYELVCEDSNIIGVTIIHKEFQEEVSHSLVDGKTRIAIYEEEPQIFLFDADHKRYCTTIDYTLHKYLSMAKFEETIFTENNHRLHLLYLFSKYNTYGTFGDNTVHIWKQILQLPGLREEYYYLCLENLVEYYYDQYDSAQLDSYLMRIDIHKVRPNKRMKFIEYFIQRRIQTLAIEGLKTYGFEGVSTNHLVKFCSAILSATEEFIQDEVLLQLCYYVYSLEKYNDDILMYLVKYYYGPTTAMYSLWKIAMNFELDTHELEERLLVQMLFTGSYVQDSFNVFSSYYRNITNHVLVKAFLSYYGYRYLVHDRVVDDEFFSIMRRELLYDENDIYLLSWLKKNTTIQSFSENDINFIDYNLHQLEQRGLVLPYLTKYRNVVKLPIRMRDKFYVDYKTDPKKQVFIHYRIMNTEEKSDYVTERMSNVFMGIHVKEFVLFYHEILQYYITEEYDGKVNVTESFNVEFEKETLEEDETKYNQINLMLMSKELQDEVTLLDMMEQYVIDDYMISKIFRLIE